MPGHSEVDESLVTSPADVSRFTHHVLRAAFSLIEILVVVALLSVIILGLLAMFHQVQKAFMESMAQVDVLESGRAVTDMVARDIDQVIATQLPDNNGGLLRSTNFLTALNRRFFIDPMYQFVVGTTDKNGNNPRTNIIQDLFFVSKVNQNWFGIGYQVRPDNTNGGVGTLYRFNTSTDSLMSGIANKRYDQVKAYAMLLSSNFNVAASTALDRNPPMNRIADGIVHFSVKAFDTNGVPFVLRPGIRTLSMRTNNSANPSDWPFIQNAYGDQPDNRVPDRLNYAFVSNALPGSIELEVGFLEPRILDRYRALAPNVIAQRNYLSNHCAQVHLFRQRIPIRNVDFSAYQ